MDPSNQEEDGDGETHQRQETKLPAAEGLFIPRNMPSLSRNFCFNLAHGLAKKRYFELDSSIRYFFLNLLMRPSWAKQEETLKDAYALGLIFLRTFI
jgi:hypothetical protein